MVKPVNSRGNLRMGLRKADFIFPRAESSLPVEAGSWNGTGKGVDQDKETSHWVGKSGGKGRPAKGKGG